MVFTNRFHRRLSNVWEAMPGVAGFINSASVHRLNANHGDNVTVVVYYNKINIREKNFFLDWKKTVPSIALWSTQLNVCPGPKKYAVISGCGTPCHPFISLILAGGPGRGDQKLTWGGGDANNCSLPLSKVKL